MRSIEEISFSQMDSLKDVLRLMYQVNKWNKVLADYEPHAYRQDVCCDYVVDYSGEYVLRVNNGETGFFVPDAYVHKASRVRGEGDKGVLLVKRVWASAMRWV